MVRRVCHILRCGVRICAGHKQQEQMARETRTSVSAMMMDWGRESGPVLKKKRQRDVTMLKGRLQKKGRELRG